MRISIAVLFMFMVLVGCKEEKVVKNLAKGNWLVELELMDNQVLPFNLKVEKNINCDYEMNIINADEVIRIDEVEVKGDSIFMYTPVFEGFLAGTFTDSIIEGQFIKESLDRIVPFKAIHGVNERFMVANKKDKENVTGIWETYFSPNLEEEYVGKGIFLQEGNKVTGTFRTTTGDYRFLDGVMDGDSLKLSAFDGAHAFLFTAKVTDSSMNGVFYSGNHFKEPFVATRNDDFELPDPDSLTFLNEGYDKLAFTFPDSNGDKVSLSDDRFHNKVVIVQLMGTWCPNCLDETKFLVEYMAENKDIEVIGLAFESAKTEDKAFKGIQRLKDRIGVGYPILLAQYGTYDKLKAQEKLPMLNHVLSYPTTIFIDKKGNVRKIHTGFNGPATGEKYIEFKKEFNELVTQLNNE
ncbi:MAG TPA: TlpA family protein disulfide reductase [Maribacter sp.]|uniref:TlpA family protein disulfide reductase n=1 Tax=unclassified Maribacter TaxID=2615042 RepID=UPI000ED3401E|nr:MULTISPECIES: TlpA disulfide reductase family protein [unclassified Maribacter]HAF79219.1 TlpA family protein disulfide reductase [Maribacter sp.]|tara:strand:- start:94367 stop:95590 length:1224 start_codon:yes stop_codon:yes gene_type:complete